MSYIHQYLHPNTLKDLETMFEYQCWMDSGSGSGSLIEFIDCTLKQDVGPYVKGSKHEIIAIDLGAKQMRFTTVNGTVLKSFTLLLEART